MTPLWPRAHVCSPAFATAARYFSTISTPEQHCFHITTKKCLVDLATAESLSLDAAWAWFPHVYLYSLSSLLLKARAASWYFVALGSVLSSYSTMSRSPASSAPKNAANNGLLYNAITVLVQLKSRLKRLQVKTTYSELSAWLFRSSLKSWTHSA